ncbi:hypothetical protein PCE1_002022 [Barthelona sp. PCE]
MDPHDIGQENTVDFEMPEIVISTSALDLEKCEDDSIRHTIVSRRRFKKNSTVNIKVKLPDRSILELQGCSIQHTLFDLYAMVEFKCNLKVRMLYSGHMIPRIDIAIAKFRPAFTNDCTLHAIRQTQSSEVVSQSHDEYVHPLKRQGFPDSQVALWRLSFYARLQNTGLEVPDRIEVQRNLEADWGASQQHDFETGNIARAHITLLNEAQNAFKTKILRTSTGSHLER